MPLKQTISQYVILMLFRLKRNEILLDELVEKPDNFRYSSSVHDETLRIIMRFLSHAILIFCFLVPTQDFTWGQESANQEAEQIEIARKLVDRLFVDPGKDSLSHFPMSDAMKEYLPSDTFREWAKAIVDDYGKPGKPEKIEVVRQENGRQNVYLFCHCNRYPIKIWVTFNGTVIDGFHWGPWKEESERLRKEERQAAEFLILFFILGLPILCFLIILVGEGLRNRSVKRRREYLEQLDFDPAAEEVYQESQNPLWCYVLMLIIFACCLLPLVFIPEIASKETFVVSIIISIAFLPLFCVFGFFFVVDRRKIVVRMGLLRIPILRISLDSILSAEIMEFRPLMDFGGWGIRNGKGKTKGYFMSGNRGVLITTDVGKKYLFGSDTPERLVQVIKSRLSES